MYEGFGTLVKLFLFAIPFSILGVWKLVEVIIWLFQHINIKIV